MAHPGAFPESLEARFEVVRLLGQGSFGRVVLARDRQLDRPVAIKIHAFSSELPDAVERFQQEARITARVDLPEVVRIYDHGVEPGGEAWIVYEFLAGDTLAAKLAREVRLPVETCLDWGARIARALVRIHQQGVVHRDIKPANLMVREGGGPVLCDFGLAWAGPRRDLVTQDGLVLGTPAYMPPELFFGGRPSPAGDQYAWAAVVYEMALGRKLQPDPDPSSVMDKFRSGVGPDFRSDEGELPLVLRGTLDRALRAKPEERFRDMEEFARALEGRVSLRPRTSVPRGRSTIGGSRTRLVSSPAHTAKVQAAGRAGRRLRWAGLLLGVGLVGAVAWRWLGPGAPAPPPPAPPPATAPEGPSAEELARAAARTALADMLRFLGEPAYEVGPPPGYKDDEHLNARLDELIDPWYATKYLRYADALEVWLPKVGDDPEALAAVRRHREWLLHLILDFEGAFEHAEVPTDILSWRPQGEILPILSKVVSAWTEQLERLRGLVDRLVRAVPDSSPEVQLLLMEVAVRSGSKHLEPLLRRSYAQVLDIADPARALERLDQLTAILTHHRTIHVVDCAFRLEVFQQSASRHAAAADDLAGKQRALGALRRQLELAVQDCRGQLGELELASFDRLLDKLEVAPDPSLVPALEGMLEPFEETARLPSTTVAVRLDRLRGLLERLAPTPEP